MQSVNPSIKPFCSLLRETNQVWLLQLCFPNLTGRGGLIVRSSSTTFSNLASALLNGQTTNGKRSTVKMLPGSVLLCPGQVPGQLGWAYPEQLGLSSTACGLLLGDSIRPFTNGVSFLHRIASVAPLSKPQTMF